MRKITSPDAVLNEKLKSTEKYVMLKYEDGTIALMLDIEYQYFLKIIETNNPSLAAEASKITRTLKENLQKDPAFKDLLNEHLSYKIKSSSITKDKLQAMLADMVNGAVLPGKLPVIKMMLDQLVDRPKNKKPPETKPIQAGWGSPKVEEEPDNAET